MREVISVHTGQAGVQLGDCCWELYCIEHKLDPRGSLSPVRGTDPPSDTFCDGFNSFFMEMQTGNFSPRAVLVDLESTPIDVVRTGKHKQLYMPNMLLAGTEDAANNFARGYYTTGRKMVPKLMDALRRQAEACDKLQGFFLFHSFGGGSGSGFNALIVESLEHDYGKKSKIEIAIFPSPTMATAVVEPYNAVLSTHMTLQLTDCVLLADNEAMYNICHAHLDIDSPTYSSLNRLLAQAVSSMTASLRFMGSLNADFTDFQTNLVPYPRIHFPVVSYAPILANKYADHGNLSVSEITNRCFETSNRMVKCITESGRYMACVLLYRGDVAPKDVNAAIHTVKAKRSVRFVGWSPSGFKVGINSSCPAHVEVGDLAHTNRAVCMLSNTTAIREAWTSINIKFHLMKDRKAFFHHYTGEGLEEKEFDIAQDNLLGLEQDYEMLTKE
ncbi:unnamed protein product [Nezara viridula]|uniref:Tubulin alpha chain n=1 Tax=Nezara viridula TaxID=85310 RepID=A0A9P0MKN4_NEZVI|nr:unnamed protein product [Nezara viridula]